jgi:hypothetical protein
VNSGRELTAVIGTMGVPSIRSSMIVARATH